MNTSWIKWSIRMITKTYKDTDNNYIKITFKTFRQSYQFDYEYMLRVRSELVSDEINKMLGME
jgi:hypothetical protein